MIDESFFNALNGYMQKPENQKIPLAILPVGTGNSLSRDASVEEGDLESFIKLLNNGKKKRYDIAKAENKNETFYYTNMIGFGFINNIIETASHL